MFSPDKKPYRIGVINYTPVAEPALEGLKDGLTRLGTGRDSGFEFIYAGVIPDKGALKREAERLNRVGVDLIYAMSTPASLAARQATETSRIPVVFGPVNSPVKAGIVKAMDRPGGNVTGVAFGPQESKRLEMLQKIIPGVKQIFVPYNPDDRSPVLGVKALEAGADLLGLRILARGVRSYEDFKAAVDELYGTIDAVVVPTDPFVISIVPNIAGFCIDRRLPLTTPNRESVEK
ncbi:MAG: ABC transporter substrate-binding protein, partial [Desulfobacterales bacterium]|nr:ABC transporter substrate-binding protein [Desulfobacterales bacterium]